MHVYGPSSLGGVSSIHGAHGPHAPHTSQPAAPGSTSANDRLDISEAGQLASQIHDLPEIRSDLVARVKAQIQAGAYETPDKFNAAAERLLDELA